MPLLESWKANFYIDLYVITNWAMLQENRLYWFAINVNQDEHVQNAQSDLDLHLL